MTTTDDVPNEIQKAKERAVRLLARRDHSAFELRAKLRQKLKVSESTWTAVLSFLKESGYMADEDDLALRWVRQWRAEGRGRHWIYGKLRSKGLATVPLNDDEEEVDAARLFVAKKIRGKTPASLALAENAKLGRAMVSRGFSSSVVASLLRAR